MTYENLQAKTDVLISVYENIHKHIRKNEALENKVIFSAAAAITSLFVELPPSKQDGASQKSIVTPSNSQAEKYLDIKPRPIGQ